MVATPSAGQNPARHDLLVRDDSDFKRRHCSVSVEFDLHKTNLARTSKTFHVVIIGGSFAGIRAAQELENLLYPHMVTITVIERRDQYFYNLGGLRSMAKEELIDLVWLPYDKIFQYPHNRVIKGEVVSVHPNSVILKDGNKVDFDALLVSSGSVYPAPCKIESTSHLQGKAEQRAYFHMVKAADSILIIGGGPTGVGLAAEIATQYPSKTIILAHAGPRLLSIENNSESMSRKAHKKLRSLGVQVFLNERVLIPEDGPLKQGIECRWLKTSRGRKLFSNLQFLCNGISFETSFMDSLDPVRKYRIIDAKTRQIHVLPTLQINHPELPWIFSAGDVCDTEGEKQAYRADSQGAHVARSMARMAEAWAHGNPRWFSVPLKQWSDPAQFMAVPLGPNAGVTDTPWIVLGDLPTRIMKSRELFLARRYREFNLEFPGASRPRRDSISSSRSAASIISSSAASSSSDVAHHAHIRAASSTNSGVPTDLRGASYDLSRAMTRMAIATAENLDEKFHSDRVSLSRPQMKRGGSGGRPRPLQQLPEVDNEPESDDDEPVSPAQLYAQTAPSSRYIVSSGNNSSNHSQKMFKAPNASSASVSSSGTSSSGGSRAPSMTSTLLYGPVIPRQGAKDSKNVAATPSFFKSCEAINGYPLEEEEEEIPPLSRNRPTAVYTRHVTPAGLAANGF